MTRAEQSVGQVLAWLERRGSKRNRDGMARYAIVAPKVFGVSVGTLRQLAKTIGTDRKLAAELWKSGWYEARMLAAFIDDPATLAPAEMDRRAKAFDNWAVCDTLCFHLFDKSPHAWKKIAQWRRRREEFVKRAACALLASVAQHDKSAPDVAFLESLAWIEGAADDDRNFVKKGVNWALRGIGERNRRLNAAAVKTAERLAASPLPSARWIGKDALRQWAKPAVRARLARR
jgi:3-methyladenine DNA glycosylase AlkD